MNGSKQLEERFLEGMPQSCALTLCHSMFKLRRVSVLIDYETTWVIRNRMQDGKEEGKE